MVDNISCPLCGGENTSLYFSDKFREYWCCAECELVFVPSFCHLSSEKCKAEYDLHKNDPDDQGYRKFLNRIFEPIVRELVPCSTGLDFGSGPGPTLSVMFEEAGHEVDLYDIYYAPDKSVFQNSYHFITCSEVVEHLEKPFVELQRLWNCLKPGGLLGVMTKRVMGKDAFGGWHYKNDQTHICFFADKTVEWLRQSLQAKLVFLGKDVFVFRKE